ncbi:MAG TPA: hypothetical protein VF646_07070, partial [Cytophagales bacterium]
MAPTTYFSPKWLKAIYLFSNLWKACCILAGTPYQDDSLTKVTAYVCPGRYEPDIAVTQSFALYLVIDKLVSLFENSPSGIAFIDPQGMIGE